MFAGLGAAELRALAASSGRGSGTDEVVIRKGGAAMPCS
jgi:hypothetical protein